METELPTTDILSNEPYLVRAATGKRFWNYIIDLVVFYVLAFGVGILIAIASPETIDNISSNNGFGDRILTLFLYGFYMSLVETIFKGKSLGKFITKTRAVTLDGSPISASTAFGRGFSRAVPFAVFSAFGTPCNPWQDKWTNTMVIDEKQSHIPGTEVYN